MHFSHSSPLLNKVIIYWCLFEFALGVLVSPFLITFPLYVSHYLSTQHLHANSVWELVSFFSAIMISIFSPLFGLVFDRYNKNKMWLLVVTVILGLCYQSLWLIYPSSHYLIDFIILIIVLNCLGALLRIILNAIMSELAPDGKMGKLSYMGFMAFVLGSFIGFVSAFLIPGISRQFYSYTLYFPTIFILLSIPFLIAYRPASVSGLPREQRVENTAESYKNLRQLFKEHPAVLKFILSRAFIYTGFTGFVISFPIFIHTEFSLSENAMIKLYFSVGVMLFIGSFVFGWLDDKIGPKKILLIASMVQLCLAIAIILSSSVTVFIMLVLFMGLFIAPMLASMRSLLLLITPRAKLGVVMGGCYLTGRMSAFLSPLIYMIVYAMIHRQKVAILLTLVTVPIGIWLLCKLKAHPRSNLESGVAS